MNVGDRKRKRERVSNEWTEHDSNRCIYDIIRMDGCKTWDSVVLWLLLDAADIADLNDVDTDNLDFVV